MYCTGYYPPGAPPKSNSQAQARLTGELRSDYVLSTSRSCLMPQITANREHFAGQI